MIRFIHNCEYVRKFTWFPRKCQDGKTEWFSNYYTSYSKICLDRVTGERWCEGDITEQEYIVRKLADNL
jgi:hypothetical protein